MLAGRAMRLPLSDDPRATMFAQHRTLRRLLENAMEVAAAVAFGDEVGLASLPYTILGLQAALERHVVSEESVMLPLVEARLPCGSENVTRWRLRHGHQIRAVAAMVDAGVQDAPVLAETLRRVAVDLLRGIDDEERTMRSAGVVRGPRAIEN